jgi:HEPN domain-containing protein
VKAVKALLYSINEAPWGHSVRILLERYFRRTGKEFNERLLSFFVKKTISEIRRA